MLRAPETRAFRDSRDTRPPHSACHAESGILVVPSIVVEDELRTRVLVEIARLPLVETFFAITLARRFPNPLLKSLIRGSDANTDHA